MNFHGPLWRRELVRCSAVEECSSCRCMMDIACAEHHVVAPAARPTYPRPQRDHMKPIPSARLTISSRDYLLLPLAVQSVFHVSFISVSNYLLRMFYLYSFITFPLWVPIKGFSSYAIGRSSQSWSNPAPACFSNFWLAGICFSP